MKRTASGPRNTRAEFQQNSPTTDNSGQSVASWTTKFKRWVSLSVRGGSERWIWEQIRAEVDSIIRAEWDLQLSQIVPATWRVKIGSRLLNIDSIFDPDGNRKTLQIMATEIVT